MLECTDGVLRLNAFCRLFDLFLPSLVLSFRGRNVTAKYSVAIKPINKEINVTTSWVHLTVTPCQEACVHNF